MPPEAPLPLGLLIIGDQRAVLLTSAHARWHHHIRIRPEMSDADQMVSALFQKICILRKKKKHMKNSRKLYHVKDQAKGEKQEIHRSVVGREVTLSDTPDPYQNIGVY